NFYRAIQDKTPEGTASAVALTFMGARTDSWPEGRLAGAAVFFSQISRKPTSEWKEEVVFWDPLQIGTVPGNAVPGREKPGTGERPTSYYKEDEASSADAPTLPPPYAGPITAVFPDGTKVELPPDRDPRELYADWLIQPDNPWFTKSIVNRIWAWLLGRGIVHEPDDIRDDNAPSNPELLAYLQKEMVAGGYDLKHVYRLILNSSTYQLSSMPRNMTAEAEANFAGYLPRRLDAEVLIDALNQITGATDLYTSATPEPYTYIPREMPAVALADGSVTSQFLALFGRSARATGMAGERSNKPVPSQWLHLLNSSHVQGKLASGPRMKALLEVNRPLKDTVTELYFTVLSRGPTEEELKTAADYVGGTKSKREGLVDIAWALINTTEFLYRH
ncbi:MAG: DUF1553 domain-containing protein, partial [Patescibacteria group bacterium]|nr:DUF1553 domain-containing protein [Patescibacteria group bacterium]